MTKKDVKKEAKKLSTIYGHTYYFSYGSNEGFVHQLKKPTHSQLGISQEVRLEIHHYFDNEEILDTFINVFVNNKTSQYLFLTDDEIQVAMKAINELTKQYINSDDILLDSGFELVCANFHTYKGALKLINNIYPDYKEASLETIPLNFKEAKEFVNRYHRHHISPQGYKFAVGVSTGDEIIGVVIAGRPVSRFKDDGKTLEVTRLCVKPGYKNACSLLYAKVARIAKEMGYYKLLTYTLESENGTSLLATGFKCVGISKGGSWNVNSRPRKDKAPIVPKKRWEMVLIN